MIPLREKTKQLLWKNLVKTGLALIIVHLPLLDLKAQLPPNFQSELLISNLEQPISMTFSPSGKLFIIQKSGEILLCETGGALPMTAVPYFTIPNLYDEGEHGLLDMVLDPDFAANGYFYVFYTKRINNNPKLNSYNMVSRFTHDLATNQIVSDSEFIIWENPELNKSCCHTGGSLMFGADDKLYLTTGEDFDLNQAQDLSRAGGKVLRFNKDGSIPTDNPFVSTLGALPEVYAYGLRNPFRASFDAESGNIYIGEVGGNNQNAAWEDVNVVQPGANYGWPACGDGGTGRNGDGSCVDGSFTDPIFTYAHGGNPACVTGGVRYRGNQYPSEYQGAYFYGDYERSWIKYLTFDNAGNVTGNHEFDNNVEKVVNIKEGPDGNLYWLSIKGKLRRYTYSGGNLSPVCESIIADVTQGTNPLQVNFSVVANDSEGDPISYAWTFGDGSTSNLQNPSHTYTSNGQFLASVTVSDGSTSTSPDPVEIFVGTSPTIIASTPQEGTLFRGGDVINFSASASDTDGTLSDESYKWSFDLFHNGVLHPRFETVEGAAGSFIVPVNNHVSFSGNTGFVINLEVTDEDGLKVKKETQIWSDKSNLSLDTSPSGMQLTISGLPVPTPYTTDELINFEHEIGVFSPVQCLNGMEYQFVGWSDGGSQTHTIATPADDSTFVAIFEPIGECEEICLSKSLSLGGDTRLNLNNPVVLPNDFTIEYWIKLPNPDKKDAPISNGVNQYINYYGGTPRFRIKYATGGENVIISSMATALNEWTHYAFVRSGNEMKMYINGVEDLEAYSPDIWTDDYIMTNIGDGEGYMEGELDELRIWNVARSAAEISTNFDNGIDPASAGLELYYNFNEGSQTITDRSGNGHDSKVLPVGVSRVATTAPLTDDCVVGEIPNQNPTVDAGDDKAIELPSDTTSFIATAFDPDGLIASYHWEQMNGPMVTLANTDTQTLNLADLAEGSYTFRVTVTDDKGGSAEDQVNLTVNPSGSVNHPPVLSVVENQTVVEGQTKALPLTASDADGETVSFQLTGTVSLFVSLIDNLDNTASLTIEPLAEDAGIYELTLQATDPEGLTDELTITLEVAPSGGTEGSLCQALSMAGNGRLNLNNSVVLSGDFTIEYWIKLPQPSKNDAPISNGVNQYINYYGGTPRFRIKYATGGENVIISSIPTVPNQWTHYAFIRSGNEMKMYVNGMEDVAAYSPDIWTADYVMNNIGDGEGYMEGELDELRIWNVARSASEIGANYNKGVDPISAGLELYYSFDEDSVIIADRSGHGHDSQLPPVNISRTIATAPLIGTCEAETNQALGDESYVNDGFVSFVSNNPLQEVNSNFETSLFPNPVQDHLSIKYSGLEDKQLKVVIYDGIGRPVYTKQYTVADTTGLLEIRFQNRRLSRGLYIVKCMNKAGASKEHRMIRE